VTNLSVTHTHASISHNAQSDPGDAFNQFWNIMQGMLDNLSQPVAFATVPLGNVSSDAGPQTPATTGPRREGSTSSDTDIEEPIISRLTKRIGLGRQASKLSRLSGSSGTNTTSQDEDEFDELFEDGLSVYVKIYLQY
jgi:hypothetical protein